MTEIEKLSNYLQEHEYNYDYSSLFDGEQITVYDEKDEYLWDVVCHSFSYGHQNGLLEAMGNIVDSSFDEVEGYLTAQDIINRL